MTKRLIDIIFSGVGLILLIPFFIIIALAIKLETPGPIIFRQLRIGLEEKPFFIHKFRSMTIQNEQNSNDITKSNDPRITSVGATIRKYKLDELAQLIDVFIGNMSLVGPRPEVPRYVSYYSVEQKKIIFSVRPGITDLASIMFKNENDIIVDADDVEKMYIEKILPIKISLAIEYIQNRSIIGDIKIILVTIFTIIV